MPKFHKSERLCSRKAIEDLFSDGNTCFSYPLKMVWKEFGPESQYPVQIAVTVPKRRIRKAADRNRIKRLIRESYRLQKDPLYNSLLQTGRELKMMIIYTGEKDPEFKLIIKSVSELIKKLLSNDNGQRELPQ